MAAWADPTTDRPTRRKPMTDTTGRATVHGPHSYEPTDHMGCAPCAVCQQSERAPVHRHPTLPVVVDARDAVRTLLLAVGEDPNRDGLRDTPRRVVDSLQELTAGYDADVGELLACTFEATYDELVVVRDIPFWSLCEHHMLPFHGTATVGYVPRDRVVGLSKVGRLVDAYARRLQIQEQMTAQIADAMVEHLQPLAVGVVVQATHLCMAMRGLERSATMVTSKLYGLLRERPDLRAEFLGLGGVS